MENYWRMVRDFSRRIGVRDPRVDTYIRFSEEMSRRPEKFSGFGIPSAPHLTKGFGGDWASVFVFGAKPEDVFFLVDEPWDPERVTASGRTMEDLNREFREAWVRGDCRPYAAQRRFFEGDFDGTTRTSNPYPFAMGFGSEILRNWLFNTHKRGETEERFDASWEVAPKSIEYKVSIRPRGKGTFHGISAYDEDEKGEDVEKS